MRHARLPVVGPTELRDMLRLLPEGALERVPQAALGGRAAPGSSACGAVPGRRRPAGDGGTSSDDGSDGDRERGAGDDD